MSIRRIVVVILVSLGALGAARTVAAATIAIDALAFGVGSTLTTFTGQLDGAEVNGATVDGILFQYSLGSGHVIFEQHHTAQHRFEFWEQQRHPVSDASVRR